MTEEKYRKAKELMREISLAKHFLSIAGEPELRENPFISEETLNRYIEGVRADLTLQIEKLEAEFAAL